MLESGDGSQGIFACQISSSVLVRILVTTVRKSYDPFGTQD
jgi:hypothetical protein